jgi:hypothetical protein
MSVQLEHGLDLAQGKSDAFEVLTGLRAGTEYDPLTGADDWLVDLGGAPGENGWLMRANELIVVGSVDGRNTRTLDTAQIDSARREFFGRMLKWDDDSSSRHEHYAKSARVAYLPVISTFVGAMRFGTALGVKPLKVVGEVAFPRASYVSTLRQNANHMISSGLNVSKIAKLRLSTFKRPPLSLDEHLNAFRDEGFDPAHVLESHQGSWEMSSDEVRQIARNMVRIFGNCAPEMVVQRPGLLATKVDTLNAKLAYAQKAADRLGWNYNAVDLFKAKPGVSGLKLERYYVHVGLLAILGDPDMFPSQIGNLLNEAPADALFAISHGVGLGNVAYTRNNIRSVAKIASKEDRKERVDDLMTSRPFLRLVGREVESAYNVYYDNPYEIRHAS